MEKQQIPILLPLVCLCRDSNSLSTDAVTFIRRIFSLFIHLYVIWKSHQDINFIFISSPMVTENTFLTLNVNLAIKQPHIVKKWMWSCMNDLQIVLIYFDHDQDFNSFEGPLWSWSYGSWIYNYLCNQCLSPLKLWVRIPFMERCTRYNIMW